MDFQQSKQPNNSSQFTDWEDLKDYFEGTQTGSAIAPKMRPLPTQAAVNPISGCATGECLKRSSISDRPTQGLNKFVYRA